jgi:hypothetical protein
MKVCFDWLNMSVSISIPFLVVAVQYASLIGSKCRQSSKKQSNKSVFVLDATQKNSFAHGMSITLEDAIETNRQAIGLIQSGFEEEAIRVLIECVRQTTADMPQPADLVDGLPAAVARVRLVLQIPEPVVTAAAPVTESSAESAGTVISTAAERNPSVRLPLPSLHESNVMEVEAEPPNEVPLVAVAVAVADPQTDETMPLLIAYNPAFVLSSVLTDDIMDATPVRLENDPIFTIYNRAFDFDKASTDALTDFTWLRCASNIATVLLFNAGLACHVLAVQTESDDWYAEAMHYYTISAQSVRGQMESRQYDGELDLLVMALYNNLGHCYECWGSQDQDTDSATSLCFDYVRSIFVGSNSRLYAIMNTVEYQFFVQRLTLGLYKQVQSPLAPAA